MKFLKSQNRKKKRKKKKKYKIINIEQKNTHKKKRFSLVLRTNTISLVDIPRKSTYV